MAEESPGPAPAKLQLFYSWQSELPGKVNKNFIERALLDALKQLTADGSIVTLDRDTLQTPGAPNIVETIFQKICDADLFVADVTVVNRGSFSEVDNDGIVSREPCRPSINNNVAIETGYALHALSRDRVILVYNTAFGKIEDLPFNLRQARPLTYNATEGDIDRATVRKPFVSTLVHAIGLITGLGPKTVQTADGLSVDLVAAFFNTAFEHVSGGRDGPFEFLYLCLSVTNPAIRQNSLKGARIIWSDELIATELNGIASVSSTKRGNQDRPDWWRPDADWIRFSNDQILPPGGLLKLVIPAVFRRPAGFPELDRENPLVQLPQPLIIELDQVVGKPISLSVSTLRFFEG